MFCAWLEVPTFWLLNVRPAGDRDNVTTTPVPVRVTACGVALSVATMLTAPVRVPAVVGVKVTLMAQLLLAPMLLPQVLVWA